VRHPAPNRHAFLTCILAAASLIVLAVCFLIWTPGCATTAHRSGTKAPPDRSEAVQQTSRGVGESAAAIDEARADATAKAPEVQPESDRIGAETDRLRQYQRDLDLAVKDLVAARKRADALEAENASLASELEKAKADAEKGRDSVLRWVFASIAGLALIGAVVGLLVLKNMPWALVCGAVVAACIGATQLLAWKVPIATGMLVLLAAATAYALWRQHRTATELVLTAEAFKQVTPGDTGAVARAAEQIQTEATKAFVRMVRDPIKKKLAERAAFSTPTSPTK